MLNAEWLTKNESTGVKSYWYEGGIRQGTTKDPKGVIGDGTNRGREIYEELFEERKLIYDESILEDMLIEEDY